MSAAAPPAVEERTTEKSKLRGSEHAEEARWRPILSLPCQLTVELSLPDFTVADFLSLRSGSVIGTQGAIACDLPVLVNGIVIAWGELEGTGNRLAVRLTELA